MKLKLQYYLYYFLFRSLAVLSLPILYIVSDCLYFVLYKIVGYRVKTVRKNLSESFPSKSDTELSAIERGFYHQLCDNIVESIKLLNISDRQIFKHVNVTNPEIVEEIASKEKPIVLFTAHLANWEWVPAIQMFYNIPAISGELYKPLHDKAFDMLMLKIRSRFNSLIIPRDSAYRDILALHRNNKTFIIGFVADHRSNSALLQNSTEFLNHPTSFEVGAEKIGDKIGAEYLYLHIDKPSRGKYVFTFERLKPSSDKAFPFMREYYKQLENNIKQYPALWLWSHRRWIN